MILSVTDEFENNYLIIEPNEVGQYENAPSISNNNFMFGWLDKNCVFHPSSRYKNRNFTVNFVKTIFHDFTDEQFKAVSIKTRRVGFHSLSEQYLVESSIRAIKNINKI